MCMESKDPGMGLPAGAVTSIGTATMVAPTPNGSSETASARPDAARPAINAEISLGRGGGHGASLLYSSSSTPPGSSYLPFVSSPYLPGSIMAAAIVPASPGGFSFISSSPAGSGFESMKKKRGRPRKYGPDGSLALTVAPLSALSPSPMSPSQKRGRGRPPGSGKNQQLAALGELMLGSIGAGFTPHAITVATGEDIASRIMSFSQQGPRGICILSANGAISSVTLRQPSISGGTVTYEGRFEILSLSGSFISADFAGARSRTGGLSVSLAGPDGRVVGGGVAGVLIAASPVQVIVGSFLCQNKKLPKPPRTEAPSPGLAMARPQAVWSPATPNSAPPMSSGLRPNMPSMAMGNPAERKPEAKEFSATAESSAANPTKTEGDTPTLKPPQKPLDQAVIVPPQSMVEPHDQNSKNEEILKQPDRGDSKPTQQNNEEGMS